MAVISTETIATGLNTGNGLLVSNFSRYPIYHPTMQAGISCEMPACIVFFRLLGMRVK
jgi:hypothetical protein